MSLTPKACLIPFQPLLPLSGPSPHYLLRVLTQGVSLEPWTQPTIALGQANVLPKPGFSEASAAGVPNPKQL